MKTRKELKQELKQKSEELQKIITKDQKLNEGFYRSKGNTCPTKAGFKASMKRHDLEVEVGMLKENSTLLGYRKYKKRQEHEQEIQTTRAKTLTKTKK